jgi:hypothetical protein
MLVEDPLGGFRRWRYIPIPDEVEEGYESPGAALAVAVPRYIDSITWSRELRAKIDAERREFDQEFLRQGHPTLSLTQPWSFMFPASLPDVAEVIVQWGTNRSFFSVEQGEVDSTHGTYIVNEEEGHVLGTIHMRAVDDKATEVIYVSGAYHRNSALVSSSLYMRLDLFSIDDTSPNSRTQLKDSYLDDIFNAWYAEQKKGKRITLKQWAAQVNISYHYLSRHHKAYKQRRQLAAKAEHNESQ